MERRLLAAAGMIGLGLMLVLTRLVYLTVLQDEELARQADLQHRKRTTVMPRRGAILDRNGEPLALSVPTQSLFVRPHKVPADIHTQIPALAAALHMSPHVVSRLVHSSSPFVWLKRRATPQETAQVDALNIAGMGSLGVERRFYPQGVLAAPVIGFTDIDTHGLEGVELAYDRYLRGEPSERLEERDAFGRTILAQGAATLPEGFQVRLTLDTGLQYLAERELTRAVQERQARAGTAVILNPRTFEVLALAQAPTFNPNAPAASPAANRRNRTISDCYEPGSTLKAVLAAAALDTNRVRPQERVFCERGRYQVGKHVINDYRPFEWLTFTQVIQRSSNIGVAKIGERLGQEIYYRYLRAFGFGRLTGIDLPGEIKGILPPLALWSRIKLVTASFGQGVAVTPLQLACAFAALANGGVLMRPYIVREILTPDGKVVLANSPLRLWQAVRAETAQHVLTMLEQVVERDGTGWRAHIEGFRVAGKTGTSQKASPHGGYSAQARIASFVGAVPANQPRLVILVVIDEPQTGTAGGAVAAPVFQAIARQALAYLGIAGNLSGVDVARKMQWTNFSVSSASAPLSSQQPSLHHLVNQGPTTPQPLPAVMGTPNFLGLSLREAVRMAERNGWRVATRGSGYVMHQTVTDDPHSKELVYVLTLAPAGETPS